MKTLKFLIVALVFSGFWSCKEDQKILEDISAPVVSTFYFIRHAEKDRSISTNTDPELTQKGLGRAMGWAEIFEPVLLDAIYSTDYERTSMTAAPTSIKKDITLQYYNPNDINIQQFMADNLGLNVLIVGHSNTTPDFVNKMLGEDKYDSLDDYDNGSLFIIKVVGEHITDMRLSINTRVYKN